MVVDCTNHIHPLCIANIAAAIKEHRSTHHIAAVLVRCINPRTWRLCDGVVPAAPQRHVVPQREHVAVELIGGIASITAATAAHWCVHPQLATFVSVGQQLLSVGDSLATLNV